MSGEPWSCDRELDPARVAALIAARWADLAGLPVSFLAEGWDSQVYQVGGEWVFRFPKRAEVEADFVKETALLPELDLGEVCVPAFERAGEPDALFPYRFVGYRKIPGRPGDQVPLAEVPLDPFAGQVGRALTALHAFPLERARALGVPEDMASRRLAVMRDRALARLPEVAAAIGEELAAAVRASLESPPPEFAGELVLVHNDLMHEHFILDERGALAGIIDWSDAGIGDPAVDLVGLHTWGGPSLVDRVIAHYRGALDAGARERVRYRALCVGVYCAVFALSSAVPGHLEWARGVLELTASR